MKFLSQFFQRRKGLPTKPVPEADYELLKFIRTTLAQGDNVIMLAGQKHNQRDYMNAKILHEHYDMDKDEVLQTTGFWIQE